MSKKIAQNDVKATFQKYMLETSEVGYVEKIIESLVYVSGLPGARVFEEIFSEEGHVGYIFSIDRDHVICLMLSSNHLFKGLKVVRTNELIQVRCGEGLLNHVISPLGESLEKGNPIVNTDEYRILDSEVPSISQRSIIDTSLHTGVTVVDMMVPLGKGQRELVIGDRGTGKNWFVNSVIKSQSKEGLVCIYCAVGKKKASIETNLVAIRDSEKPENIISLTTFANDPLGLIYLAPYSAMTIAEYFRDQGRDVLVVFDDLGTHAKVYREISLLCKRFPGRNSYPSDIFFTHSKLLERAGNFKGMNKNVSITCLPIVESIGGDISGYVQTNLMSMTDGHIFFDIDLYNQGIRPAINHYLSVTRVGRQTQTPIRYKINRELNAILSLYERTKAFIHFGAEISEGVKLNLRLGEKLNQFFDQTGSVVVPSNVQILVFSLIWSQKWESYEKEKIQNELKRIIYLYENDQSFSKMVNDMVSDATDLNSFLSLLEKNQDSLQKKLFPEVE
jgi:F-type H+-transporting ATPase subunit alpha